MTTFEDQLRAYSQRAQLCLSAIRDRPRSRRSHTFLYVQLRGYVCGKLMLEPEECDSDSLAELSAASITKVTGFPKGELEAKDLSMNCAGISSVETKKILLLIALQRGLEIKIDPEMTPLLQTVEDLTDLVETALEEREALPSP